MKNLKQVNRMLKIKSLDSYSYKKRSFVSIYDCLRSRKYLILILYSSYKFGIVHNILNLYIIIIKIK